MPSATEIRRSSVSGGEATTLRKVTAEDFCQMAVSRRSLQRWDDHRSGRRGLLDSDTGILYTVDEVALLDFEPIQAPRLPR
jgi:hypothetical protein